MYSPSSITAKGFLIALLQAFAAYSAAAEVLGAAPVTVSEIAGCSDKIPRTKSSEVGEVRREGEALVVSVLANTYCGGVSAALPEAEIRGSSVSVSWIWEQPKGAPLTACTCTRHLQFRVIGAPQGELTVTSRVRAK